MSFVSDIVAPIIQTVFYIFFFGGLCFFSVRYFRKKNPNFFLFIKYKIFRKKWDEKAVKWCINCINKGYTYNEIEKLLLVGSYPLKKTKERLYVFKNVQRKLQKGGNNQNEQFRQGNPEHEIKEIPSKKS